MQYPKKLNSKVKPINVKEFNLSDFALFLSVMKDEAAFCNVLSIILGKEIVKLKSIRVEDVILNEKGKRGIRLDAYMKYSTLENPNVIVKDPRIIELDQIVTEVKNSEEWEVVTMNILERGTEIGKEIGKEMEQITIVYNMSSKGLDSELIIEYTGIDKRKVTKTIEIICNHPNMAIEEWYQILKQDEQSNLQLNESTL